MTNTPWWATKPSPADVKKAKSKEETLEYRRRWKRLKRLDPDNRAALLARESEWRHSPEGRASVRLSTDRYFASLRAKFPEAKNIGQAVKLNRARNKQLKEAEDGRD